MPRTAGLLSFPDFRGFTRGLILWNVGAYFLLLLLQLLSGALANAVVHFGALIPPLFLHGFLWQIITYCFIHVGILGTALEMLSLWFLGSFLESNHGPRWLAELFFTSVVGAGLAAIGLSLVIAPTPLEALRFTEPSAGSSACSLPSVCFMATWNS